MFGYDGMIVFGSTWEEILGMVSVIDVDGVVKTLSVIGSVPVLRGVVAAPFSQTVPDICSSLLLAPGTEEV